MGDDTGWVSARRMVELHQVAGRSGNDLGVEPIVASAREKVPKLVDSMSCLLAEEDHIRECSRTIRTVSMRVW